MTWRARPPDWYRDWFGEEYLSLYPHRDAEEARAAVDLVLRVAGPPEGLVLDLACGAGRHMIEFKRRGLTAIGLDLSGPLLRQARAEDPDLILVRGDMRHLPFGDGSFQLVANFFTSFGYFEDPDEDFGVLAEIRRVLRPGGRFALDFLNAQRVRSQLVEDDERSLGQRRVVQKRRLEDNGNIVVKKISIFEPDQEDPVSTYFERVRLYSPEELLDMLQSAGLQPEDTFGDYAGGPACSECPRYILLGHAR
jgi:SAM-dependent methyltransferase